jgi:hypothetical protein
MRTDRLAPTLLAILVLTGCARPAWRWSHPSHADQIRFNSDLMQCQQYAATTAPYTQRYGEYDLGTALLFGSRQAAYESGVGGCMSRLGYSFYRADTEPQRYPAPAATSATATTLPATQEPESTTPEPIAPVTPAPPSQPAIAALTNLETWVPGRWQSSGGTNMLIVGQDFSWQWQSTFGGDWKGNGSGRLEGNKIVLTGSFSGFSSAGQRVDGRPITITLTREGNMLAAELFTSRTWNIVFERQ